MKLSALDLKNAQSHRVAIHQQAKVTLSKIFTGVVAEYHQKLSHLDILIPCAGYFPGYQAFMEVLKERFLALRSVKFVLVDGDEKALKIFGQYHHDEKTEALKVTYETHQMGLQDFLAKNQQKFDIVFFEHPEVTSMICVLRISQQPLMLRQALPYLNQILNPHALVMAVCKNYEELIQMKSLLRYGLDAKEVTSAHKIWAWDYSAGAALKSQPHLLLKAPEQKARSAEIKESDSRFFLFVLAAAYLYWNTGYGNSSHLSFLLVASQFLAHRPGNTGNFYKFILVTAQLLILINQEVSKASISPSPTPGSKH
jgi:hypothetical protein